MKRIKTIVTTILLSLLVTNAYGQESRKVSGKILSSLNTPIQDAIVSAKGAENVTSDSDGSFQIELKAGVDHLSVWASGYYTVNEDVDGRSNVIILMIPENQYKYNQTLVLPFRTEESIDGSGTATNIAKKDFVLGRQKIGQALNAQVAGLRVTPISGMPGEGSYMNLRGIRSLTSTNAPLIVLNGVPYMPDSHESQLLMGLSRDQLQAYNINDIQNITVLKGADASIYGSMGANGVIMIETDGTASDDLETKISYYGVYGTSWNSKRMPLLEGMGYKSYLSDIGMSYFGNMESFFVDFPFLQNPNGKYGYLYNNTTDWQDEIYKNGFMTENLFRVEGGDNIAKYDLSVGYALDKGVLNNTQMQRYHTLLNTNVLISKQFEMFATVGLAYMNGHFQEQGMSYETNPILASYMRSPLLSPYKKDSDGKLLQEYSSYYYGNSTNMDFAVSNPLAIVNTLDAHNKQYDVNLRAGLTYRPMQNLSFTGTVGLFYNYNGETLFIPGVDGSGILPIIDRYGRANNSVKNGVAETMNLYLNLNGSYQKQFGTKHLMNVLAGWQLMTTRNEYDGGMGRNTPNDFYQTLGNTESIGRRFFGYLEKWNWMNFYAHGDYTYNDVVKASVNLAVDGASSTGVDAARFYAYPSVGVTGMLKNWLLPNSTWVNRLDVRGEYSLTGNSRFSSNLAKYYYTSAPYQEVSGIVRAGIPNTKLKPEQSSQINLGLDLSALRNRISLSLDYYNTTTRDVIFAMNTPAVFGSSLYFDNSGKTVNQGIELALQASLLRFRNFEWIVGGNIAKNNSKISAIEGVDEVITSFSDGSKLISKVGNTMSEFYGYQAAGVFSTQAEANAANLKTRGGLKYAAGDVHFVDQNKDNIIDENDRVALGKTSPDFFGGFYTNFRYKGFSLAAEFAYSKGNKAYNAVRRALESVSTFGNQSIAVVNRWSLEGQHTDMPRAQWGDPLDNNAFSSRWIEDASFVRMRNVTLSYNFDKKFLNFFRSGTVYVTGENLLTWTKYLGMDPELAYSYSDTMQGFDYAKLVQPKAVKLGINLKF
ncbi:MAG: SusC/RagA family TonB-linked outer membrane protein [Prevotellaceae bacterium]|nr:SusC/RagA family TonB-linked outer membrane protein [Prevotellaceae bacterium]